MKVLANSLQKQLDAAQLKKQVGFRCGFSAINHINTIEILLKEVMNMNPLSV